MIKSDAELQLSLEQMGRLYMALAAIRHREEKRHPGLYAIMAEGPIDELQKFQYEIDEYTGLAALRQGDVDVWLGIHGPDMDWTSPPTSVLTFFLDVFRKGVQVVAELTDTGKLTTRPTKELLEACNLRLVALGPGSVQVGLRLPVAGNEESEAKQRVVEKAMEEYCRVAAWAASDQADPLETIIPDEQRRKVVLNAIKPLVPRKRGLVDYVEIRGRRVPRGETVRLTKEAHAKVDQALEALVAERIEGRIGILREIDLDRATFVIKDEANETTCEFSDEFYEIAKAALDRPVLVAGPIRRWGSRRKAALLHVVHIEILDDESIVGDDDEEVARS